MWKPPAASAPSGTRVQSNMASATVGGVRAFGLQLPKSKQPAMGAGVRPPAKAFSMADDEEEEGGEAAPTRAPTQLASIRAQKYAREAARVLEENPDAFAYDDLFETETSMKPRVAERSAMRLGLVVGGSAAAEAAAAASTAAAPAAPSRYISQLLSKSAARKLESEAIYERNQLRERAKDDAEHEGKEKFVTAAFREQQAAQEALRAAQEEQDKRDEAAERLRSKGGVGSATLAMQASRAILDARAGVAPPTGTVKPSQSAIATATAATAAPLSSVSSVSSTAGPSPAAATAAPPSTGVQRGTKHARSSDSSERDERHSTAASAAPASASSSDSSIREAEHERDAKRARPHETTSEAEAETEAEAAAATGAVSHATSGLSSAPASVAPPAANLQSVALASVAAKLSSSARSSKAEEAKARLLARKQAAQSAH